jgi:hypothetical protein
MKLGTHPVNLKVWAALSGASHPSEVVPSLFRA